MTEDSIDPRNNQPSVEKANTDRLNQMQEPILSERRSPKSWLECATLLFDILLFIATCFYVYYARRQWTAMEHQLSTMNESLWQNKKMVDATSSQAQAAMKSAEAAARAAEYSRETADAAREEHFNRKESSADRSKAMGRSSDGREFWL